MINNYYKPGPATLAEVARLYFVRPSYARSGAVSEGSAQWYLEGNIMKGSSEITANNWLGVKLDDAGAHYTEEQLRVDTIIVPNNAVRDPASVTHYHTYTYSNYQTARDAFDSMVAINKGAGTWPHDAIDRRLLEEVKEGTASGKGTNPTYTVNGVVYDNKFYDRPLGMIDAPEGVGGYPVYDSVVSDLEDKDKDGIPDEWELTNGLDPNNPDDGNYVNSIGYIALEVYLNSLVGEIIEERDFKKPVAIQ